MFENLFKGKTNMETETNEERRITGKIIHLEEDKGWGFISSPDIKFTRIFFHWTALQQDTLNFTELEKKMKVEFTPVMFEGKKWRAIKIKVLEDGQKSDSESTED